MLANHPPRRATAGIRVSGSTRKRLLVFGNSIASQSNSAMANSTTTLSAQALAGATALTVASIAGLASGDKVAVGLYNGEVHTTTINGAPSGNTVVLLAPLPKLARSGAGLLKYTVARPGGVRRSYGAIASAVSLLGHPVEIVQGYGYGSAEAWPMLADLPAWLRQVQPDFVAFHLFENDIGNGKSLTSCADAAKYACKLTLAAGATPIMFTCMPNTSINTAPKSQVFDDLKTYILTQLPADRPGTVVLDASTPWLDTGVSTSRAPLAGWTDGVHPNANRRFTIGDLYDTTLSGILGSGGSMADEGINTNPALTGTGGTATGLQGGSVVAAGWTIYADAGVTLTASKTAGDVQRVQYSVAGASNILSTQGIIRQTGVAVPVNSGGAQAAFVRARVKINAMANISMLQPSYVDTQTGNQYSFQDSDSAIDPAMVGRTIVLETPTFLVGEGATTYDISLNIRPQTLGSPSGCVADLEILELALIPSTAHRLVAA